MQPVKQSQMHICYIALTRRQAIFGVCVEYFFLLAACSLCLFVLLDSIIVLACFPPLLLLGKILTARDAYFLKILRQNSLLLRQFSMTSLRVHYDAF